MKLLRAFLLIVALALVASCSSDDEPTAAATPSALNVTPGETAEATEATDEVELTPTPEPPPPDRDGDGYADEARDRHQARV